MGLFGDRGTTTGTGVASRSHADSSLTSSSGVGPPSCTGESSNSPEGKLYDCQGGSRNHHTCRNKPVKKALCRSPRNKREKDVHCASTVRVEAKCAVFFAVIVL